MNQQDIFKALTEGRPVYLTLNNQSVAKITMLTIDDDQASAIYEILTTVPDVAGQGIEDLNFLYKWFTDMKTLIQFLDENYAPPDRLKN